MKKLLRLSIFRVLTAPLLTTNPGFQDSASADFDRRPETQNVAS